MTRRRLMTILLLLGAASVVPTFARAGAVQPDGAKQILGFVERVIVSDTGFSVKARLDTGAATSSLDAHNIERFHRGDQRYVRFDIIDPDTEEFVTLERPLVRNVLIRQHAGPSMRRPVVKMTVCIGQVVRKVEVSLTPRSEFLYPMLIGRSAMQGAIVVDPAVSLTAVPHCGEAEFDE
jgi:hypothetical protein